MAGKFRTEHVARTPRGWRVRTVQSGAHEARIAYPPRGFKGKVVEILHPREENPGECRMGNPAELVILGNPSGGRERTERKPNAEATSEMEQAVELFEQFHGRPADEVLTAQRSAAMRLEYTALGQLLALGLYGEGVKIPSPDHWENYPHLAFSKGVKLASNAAGSQLYAIGGDQDVSEILGEMDIDASKDLIDLGEIAYVVYLARKAPNFDVVEWMHTFEQPRPRLGYDQVKREICFVGGSYTVEAPGIMH